jgi:uncharacterized membrane protein YgcG
VACSARSQQFAGQAPPPPEMQQQGPPPDQTQAPPAEGQAPPPGAGEQNQAPYADLTEAQLERLVAPIALYPDSLVAQVLAASTFPSQIVEADNWVKAHQGLSPADLGKQANEQPWDNSVKAMVQFPDVLSNLASNLGWTSELGDAYYNQPQDVMNAVQVMRQRAKNAGTLKSSQQQNVNTDNGQIEIAPANPDVVYVPAFNPWIAYGYPITPWPYWVNVPGIWWGGPGLYFGIGFPIAPFFGFGWGWHWWGMDWYHHGIYFHNAPYVARGPDFYDRHGYYGGHFGRPGGVGFANRGYENRGGVNRGGNYAYRGYQAPRGGTGVHSGPFTGYNHGSVSRGYSARGQQSMGGFHAGGFGGGSFHGGGGAHGGGGHR